MRKELGRAIGLAAILLHSNDPPLWRLGVVIARSLAAALCVVPVVCSTAENDVILLPPIEVRAPYPLVPARYRDTSLPSYPTAARERGIEGVVLLAVQVKADGRVGKVRVKASSGSAILDDAALGTVKRWTFEPAKRGPRSVESWVEVPMKFALTWK